MKGSQEHTKGENQSLQQMIRKIIYPHAKKKKKKEEIKPLTYIIHKNQQGTKEDHKRGIEGQNRKQKTAKWQKQILAYQ